MSRYDRTHSRLQATALTLFADRGYDATTTAIIADRAGVTEMTLFRHFPSKESLLLDDPFDPVIADAIRARPAHEHAMRAATEGIREAWQDLPAEAVTALRTRLRIVAAAKGLHGAIEKNSRRTIDEVAAALTDRGETEAGGRVVATAIIAGLSTALMDWARNETADLRGAVDHALALMAGLP